MTTKMITTFLMTSLIAAIIIPFGMIPDADAKEDYSITTELDADSYNLGDTITITTWQTNILLPTVPVNGNLYYEITDPNDNLVYNATDVWGYPNVQTLTAGTSFGNGTVPWSDTSGIYDVYVWRYQGRVFSDTATFQYNATDIIKPVITLVGNSTVAVEVNSVYVDAGATASDNVDGDITASIVTNNPVNTTILGTYTVTYDVSDSSNNDALQVTRTVNVVDTTIPIVTLTGANPQTIQVGGNYTEFGATASDNYDGDITASIVIDSSNVDTDVVGSYSVTYDVADSSGNDAVQVTRTVNVVLSLYCGQPEASYNRIDGTEGSDVLIGTDSADLIFGYGGHDLITGKDGNDCIFGGNGADLIKSGGDNDTIYGGGGSDYIKLGSGTNHAYGEAGTDILYSQSGTDILDGGTGSPRDICASNAAATTFVDCEVTDKP